MGRAVITETYSDVRSLLDKLVRSHKRRYGGNYDDLRADANSLFVEAYDSFDDNKGDFFTWVKYFVWIRLLYARRLQLRETKRYEDYDPDFVGRNDPNYFNLDEFLDGLSEDAAYVVRMALNPPKKIVRMLTRGERTGGTRGRPKEMGHAIREYLTKIGWTFRRVATSFNEIRKAL